MHDAGTRETGVCHGCHSRGTTSPVRQRSLAMAAALLLLATVLALSLAARWGQQKHTDEQGPAVLRSAEEAREQQERAERSYRLARTALDRCLQLPNDPHLRIGCYEEALALLQQLVAEEPHNVNYLVDMSTTLNHLGMEYSKAGRLIEAEQAYRRVVDIRVELVNRQPANLDHVTSQAEILNRLGLLLQQRGRWEDAAKAYRKGVERQAVALWTAEAHHQPTVVAYELDLALLHDRLGIVCHHLRRWPQAEENYQKALKILDKLAREHAEIPDHALHLAATRLHIGKLMRDRGDPSAALDWFTE